MWMMNSRFAYHLNHVKKEDSGKNVKAVILPEPEETVPVSSEYHSMILETKQSVVSPDNITSYYHNKEKNDFSYRFNMPKPFTPYIIIGILSLVIVAGGISFFSYVRKNQTSQENFVSSSPAEPGQNQFSENPVEFPVTEAPTPVSAVSQKDSVMLSTGTGTSSEKVYSEFLSDFAEQ